MPSFIIVRYVWRILGREGWGKKVPHDPRAAPKKPILNRVKIHLLVNGTSFEITLICNAFVPRFYKIPSALSIDISPKTKLINVEDTA